MNNFLDFIRKDIEAKKVLIANTPTKTKTNKKKFNATIDKINDKYEEYLASTRNYLLAKARSFEVNEVKTNVDRLKEKIEQLEHVRFLLNPHNTYVEKMGFDDDYRGVCRGTLFYDVARLCEHSKPKVIFCENVKGLKIHDGGNTLNTIIEVFENIGYNVFYKVLNSKDFGVPQNRERIYIVAFRKDLDCSEFKFPDPVGEQVHVRDILEKDPVSPKYYLSDIYLETLIKHRERHRSAGNGFGFKVLDLDGVSSALVCGGMGRERNLVVDDRLTDFKPVTKIKGEINHDFIRRLTPRECARLQGFPDSFDLKLSDTQLYKQLGNTVTVSVVEAIANNIRLVLKQNEAI